MLSVNFTGTCTAKNYNLGFVDNRLIISYHLYTIAA